jgi:cytosine/adenosine deaminase-related metal-dependent hydrolase
LDWRFDGLTALVSIAAGKAADLVVLAGNRAKNIDDVERVETVLNDAAATTLPWSDCVRVSSHHVLN